VKALILAAGYATRLYPLTLETPKHLLEVGGRTMVDWVLDRLEPLDVLDGVYLVTNGKFAPAFERWAGSGEGRSVIVVDDGTTSEDDRLGAIGDIGFVLDREGIDDDLLVIAGDNLFTGGIESFVAEGRRREAPQAAFLPAADDPPDGVVVLDRGARRREREAPPGAVAAAHDRPHGGRAEAGAERRHDRRQPVAAALAELRSGPPAGETPLREEKIEQAPTLAGNP